MKKFLSVGFVAVVMSLMLAVPALAEAPDLSAYTSGVTDLIGAIETWAPTLIGAVVAVVGGFYAVKLGIRFLRSMVR